MVMVSRRPAIIARLVRTPRPSRNAKPIATRTEMRFLMSDQRAQQIHRRDDALDHFPALVVDDDQAAEPKMEKQLGRLGERRVGLDTRGGVLMTSRTSGQHPHGALTVHDGQMVKRALLE